MFKINYSGKNDIEQHGKPTLLAADLATVSI